MKIEYELRPCIVSGEKALFHKWDCGGGIVELESGEVKVTMPHNIWFLDSKMGEYCFEEDEQND